MSRVAALRRSFPTPAVLFRWIAKSRRRVVCLIVGLLVTLATPPLWWATQLVGLPDVGDPFDIEAFRAFTIPEDRNAFVFYRRAGAMLRPLAGYMKNAKDRVYPYVLWGDAAPELRRWLEDNREAIALYRQGTERPDALDLSDEYGLEGLRTYRNLWSFHFLGMFEASRLEDRGDMAGAWGWYAGLLRTMHHVGMRGEVYRRQNFRLLYPRFRDRVRAWADDPGATPAMLRRAIADVIACEALAPSELDSLKTAYLEVNWLLDQPTNPGRQVPLARFSKFYHPDYTLNPEQLNSLWNAWRWWRREPERSRRVIRLITANWLAYHSLPVGSRPKPNPRVVAFDAYTFGPGSPAPARALAPEALERWFETAHDAQQVLGFLDASGVRTIEQANHAELVMILATELYRREHGKEPPTPEALVGPYLEKLPEGLPPTGKDGPIRGTQGGAGNR